MNINKGKKDIAYKCLVYGPEGIGKSTFAAHFPAPVYIDTEGSTARMDVDRFAEPEKLEDVESYIDQLRTEDHGYKTLVIDTMDRLEYLIRDKVCQENNVAGLESIGYGKGYTYLEEKANRLLGKLDALRMAKGMHILLICHGQMRKFEQPDEMGAYDRWELKLSKKVAPMVKEWADMVLFANYKTVVVKTDSGSRKAQGGKRVMYTAHAPAWDAKNRDNLPEMLDFDYKAIAHLFEAKKPTTGQTEPKKEAPKKETRKKTTLPPADPVPEAKEPEKKPEETVGEPVSTNPIEQKLREFMEKSKITEDEVIFTFHQKGRFKGCNTIADLDDWDFIEKNVLDNWMSFSKAALKYGGECPFIKHWKDIHPEGGKK